MSTFGMPGPSGSLGQCALCGKPFLAEVLLGKRVKSFVIQHNELFGHDDCLKRIQSIQRANGGRIDVLHHLPPESPLRMAFERERLKPA